MAEKDKMGAWADGQRALFGLFRTQHLSFPTARAGGLDIAPSGLIYRSKSAKPPSPLTCQGGVGPAGHLK